MPKVPVPARPVNRRPTAALRRIRQGCLIAAAVVAFLGSTAAAHPENASQIQQMVYSIGSVLAFILVVRIVIKLFFYILQAAVLLAVIFVLYMIAKVIADAIGR